MAEFYTLTEIAQKMNISVPALFFNTQLKGFPAAVGQNNNSESLYDLNEIIAWEHNRPVNLTPIN